MGQFDIRDAVLDRRDSEIRKKEPTTFALAQFTVVMVLELWGFASLNVYCAWGPRKNTMLQTWEWDFS